MTEKKAQFSCGKREREREHTLTDILLSIMVYAFEIIPFHSICTISFCKSSRFGESACSYDTLDMWLFLAPPKFLNTLLRKPPLSLFHLTIEYSPENNVAKKKNEREKESLLFPRFCRQFRW